MAVQRPTVFLSFKIYNFYLHYMLNKNFKKCIRISYNTYTLYKAVLKSF